MNMDGTPLLYTYLIPIICKVGSILKSVMEKLQSSEGDEIDSVEAKRSPLYPDFTFSKGNQRNPGIT
ncbi:hypothetical protein, partial [Paenibacillus taichungensis]|uniref:hypothetical protein n=1 Tax=Paenibacillus taichungensis TaxID=484184 RepID=UPI001C5329B6